MFATRRGSRQPEAPGLGEGEKSAPAFTTSIVPGLSYHGDGGGVPRQGAVEAIQIHDIRIALARVRAGIPLQRLVVARMMFPRREREWIRLPIIENFGVNARSRSSTPAVHTGGRERGW